MLGSKWTLSAALRSPHRRTRRIKEQETSKSKKRARWSFDAISIRQASREGQRDQNQEVLLGKWRVEAAGSWQANSGHGAINPPIIHWQPPLSGTQSPQQPWSPMGVDTPSGTRPTAEAPILATLGRRFGRWPSRCHGFSARAPAGSADHPRLLFSRHAKRHKKTTRSGGFSVITEADQLLTLW